MKMTVSALQKSHDDRPIDNAKLLGHADLVSNLTNFLESESIVFPLSIGLHGPWGSGKTSVMRTVEQKIDKVKFDTIFFEAWKHEYSNPALSLVATIAEKYADRSETAKSIIKTSMNLFTKKYFDLSIDELIQSVRVNSFESKTLPEKIKSTIEKKIGERKLLIIIDDLDRCDIENALQLLSLVKLFLDIDNCVCIAAVDFKRLERAWQKKYGIDQNSVTESISYLEKIFQLKIGIPHPNSAQIEDYLDILVKNCPDKIKKIMSHTTPKNPRSIKRILNLILFRCSVILNQNSGGEFSSVFIISSIWTILEEKIKNEILIQIYEELQRKETSLGELIQNSGHNWSQVKSILEPIDEMPKKNISRFKNNL